MKTIATFCTLEGGGGRVQLNSAVKMHMCGEETIFFKL